MVGLTLYLLHCGESVFSTKRKRGSMSHRAVSDVAAKINILNPARNRIQCIQPEDHNITDWAIPN
jgi:hypothetical protein